MRAYSPKEIGKLSIPELPFEGDWEKAFGRPSRFERWFIDGESASGKSTFVMMLGKKLCQYGKVDYLSLEEGVNLSFQKRLERLHMYEVEGRFRVLIGENIEFIAQRLKKPKSASFVIIDSVQYTGRTFAQIKRCLLDAFLKKSFIFVSQNYKGKPKGKAANDLKYDAGVKITTIGYRAYCSGRYN
ncbi:MAG: DNA repair protein RadA, partial [Bacteroides sp.]|nr:DNA repair protein RadA [Bacteroides sp.]